MGQQPAVAAVMLQAQGLQDISLSVSAQVGLPLACYIFPLVTIYTGEAVHTGMIMEVARPRLTCMFRFFVSFIICFKKIFSFFLNSSLSHWSFRSILFNFHVFFFSFEMEFRAYYPGWSAMV